MSKTLVDCGCEARVHPDGSGIEIDYCATHEAAPQMVRVINNFLHFALWHDLATDFPRIQTQLMEMRHVMETVRHEWLQGEEHD